MYRTGIVAQWVKPVLATLESQIRVPVQVLATSANAPWKAVDDVPSPWVPATHLEDLDGIPGSWFSLAQKAGAAI